MHVCNEGIILSSGTEWFDYKRVCYIQLKSGMSVLKLQRIFEEFCVAFLGLFLNEDGNLLLHGLRFG